jgi:hypothetical protein
MRQVVLGVQLRDYTDREGKARAFAEIYAMGAEPSNNRDIYGFQPDTYRVAPEAIDTVRREIISGHATLPGLYEVEFNQRRIQTENGPAYVLTVAGLRYLSEVDIAVGDLAAV